jgi:hypothetical protein
MIGLANWAQLTWLLVGLVLIGLAGLLWRAESDEPGMSARAKTGPARAFPCAPFTRPT